MVRRSAGLQTGCPEGILALRGFARPGSPKIPKNLLLLNYGGRLRSME